VRLRPLGHLSKTTILTIITQPKDYKKTKKNSLIKNLED